MRSEAAEWIAGYVALKFHPAELNALVEMTDGEIVAEVADYAADPELRRELHASTGAHWRRFLSAVTGDPFEVHPPPEAFDLARTLARRGFDLTVLLTTYRVAQRAVWVYLIETVDDTIADGDLRSAVLVRFWDRVSRWIDGSIEILVGAYVEEREQWQRGALARRTAAIHAVLRGGDTAADTLATLIGHRAHHQHTAFVLWTRDSMPESDVTRALEGTAATFGTALGNQHPLTVASGPRALWCWVTTPTPPDCGTFAGLAPRAGVQIAVGGTATGCGGFRRSHNEALAAQTVAITGRTDRTVTRYADVELACLASGVGGMAAMRAMIERELAALAAPDAATERLRRTARLYLASGGNAELTGATLRLHRNTVRYRIHQVERLIGHSIQERRVYLELALHCMDVYGAKALQVESAAS